MKAEEFLVTQPDIQSDIPTNANEHCVGTESDQAYNHEDKMSDILVE